MKNIHRFVLVVVTFLCVSTSGLSQSGFTLPSTHTKYKFSFKLINNLIVIPVEINNKKLSFLLDTGVKSTILFGLPNDSLQLNSLQRVKVRGLGQGGSVTALKSENNLVKVHKATNVNQTLYVIFDESLNFSTKMGIPIHGILGFDFFKDFVVRINYSTHKITIYNPLTYKKKKCKKCEEFDLRFHNGKPFVDLDIFNEEMLQEKVTLLIDSGSSDALWLFNETNYISEESVNYYKDFLGQGLSGSIYGKRAKLNRVSIGSHSLNNVNVAFPEELALENIKFFEERDGSIGGDFLRRFNVIFDYSSNKMSVKKNGKFKDPFHYNMSGLVLEHEGMTIVKDAKSVIGNANENNNEASSVTSIPIGTVYDILLVPKYVVSEIRQESPSALAGMKKGDEIININGRLAFRYDLDELIGLFTSKAGKKITIVYKRNGMTFKAKFVLKEMF
ncbi:aspartyl protease family protein [Candidatus Marifrigoribacter sp. Uisw_064]|uniref:aspartyl protease family protein n=1 Tax=Candidatus Marifrigoribacter sp. Uisw_064 TaxID=3230970 RepID=UPI003D410613